MFFFFFFIFFDVTVARIWFVAHTSGYRNFFLFKSTLAAAVCNVCLQINSKVENISSFTLKRKKKRFSQMAAIDDRIAFPVGVYILSV